MYLAHRGVKAANVPLVPTTDPPPELEKLRKPLVVGLVASANRLSQIRRARLSNLAADQDASSYSDEENVRDEMVKAKRYFARNGWPTIDVTRRSVEETAAKVLTLMSARQGGDISQG